MKTTVLKLENLRSGAIPSSVRPPQKHISLHHGSRERRSSYSGNTDNSFDAHRTARRSPSTRASGDNRRLNPRPPDGECGVTLIAPSAGSAPKYCADHGTERVRGSFGLNVFYAADSLLFNSLLENGHPSIIRSPFASWPTLRMFVGINRIRLQADYNCNLSWRGSPSMRPLTPRPRRRRGFWTSLSRARRKQPRR